jgi:hypothetical protein
MFERHDQKLAFLCFRAIFVSYCPLIWGSVAWPKIRSFCVLGPFSWTISHNFGVPGWFSTYLGCTTKNLSFCVFRAVFASYCPLFWGFVDIYKEYDSPYNLERNENKLIIFAFMAVFVNYCPQFWGSGVIYKAITLSTCLSDMTKNSSFLRFRAIFMSYCTQFWGSIMIYKDYDT